MPENFILTGHTLFCFGKMRKFSNNLQKIKTIGTKTPTPQKFIIISTKFIETVIRESLYPQNTIYALGIVNVCTL